MTVSVLDMLVIPCVVVHLLVTVHAYSSLLSSWHVCICIHTYLSNILCYIFV